MKPNPTKYTFEVSLKKFIWFMDWSKSWEDKGDVQDTVPSEHKGVIAAQ